MSISNHLATFVSYILKSYDSLSKLSKLNYVKKSSINYLSIFVYSFNISTNDFLYFSIFFKNKLYVFNIKKNNVGGVPPNVIC